MKLKISHYMHSTSNMTLLLREEESLYYYFKLKIYRTSKCIRFYNNMIKCMSLYKNAGIYFDYYTSIYVI